MERPGPWGRMGRQIGGMLGNHLGGRPGGALGSALGSYAHYIGRIFGSGDYVTSPGIIGMNNLINSDQVPQFGNDDGNVVRVAHREYICDILSSSTPGAFNIQNFQINPGLLSTFPWLSQMTAGVFQKYRINGMVFEFRSTSSELTTNVNLGYVVMATDYDSSDTPFTSKAQMENTSFAVSSKPSSNIIHAIECAPKLNVAQQLYLRSGSIPVNTDIRLFDLGRFSIATGGVSTASATLGELWVSYDVSCIQPFLGVPASYQQQLHLNLAGTAAATPLLLDRSVNPIQPVFNSFAGSVSLTNTSVILPYTLRPQSLYLLVFTVSGTTGGGLVPPTLFLYNGLSWPNAFRNESYPTEAAPTGVPSNGNTIIVTSIIKYDGSGTPALPPTVSFGAVGVFPGGTLKGDFFLTEINANTF